MSDVGLMVRNDACFGVSFSQTAEDQKEAALVKSSLIGKVSNADEQEKAVEAQKELKRISRLVGKARVECKKPVTDFGKAIDLKAKEFTQEIEEELGRVSAIIGDFQASEMAKVRAAEAAENERLSKLEKDREIELSKAKDLTERDEIQERFCDRIAEESKPPPQVARVKGQTIQKDWEIKVTNLALLYARHPQCMKLTPLKGEIKELLKSGIAPAGVEAKEVVKATVRATREPEAIEV